jgi:hypothetical protein
MNTTPEHNERFAMMTIASVYPLYLAKVEKKVEPRKNYNK